MAKTKYRYKKRAFLNKDHDSRGYIIADVPKAGRYSSPTMEIGDCMRHISLEFDISDDKEGLKKVEKKLELFVGIINDWAKAVREEIAHRRGGGKLVDDDD